MSDTTLFHADIERALRIAETAHRGQARKGHAAGPYVLHPVHVAILLARFGAEVPVLVAGLLHDVVEDCEGWSIARVEREFGPRVAAIVAEVTEDKTKTWEERKRWQIDHVPGMSDDALLVKAADKLHNLESLVLDLEHGHDPAIVWAKFSRGPAETLATSAELVAALEARVDPRIGRELRSALARLRALAAV
jgi:(p)ppGpp synthase/HD superfamily hydrolase